jgi:hypothetical protein
MNGTSNGRPIRQLPLIGFERASDGPAIPF